MQLLSLGGWGGGRAAVEHRGGAGALRRPFLSTVSLWCTVKTTPLRCISIQEMFLSHFIL